MSDAKPLIRQALLDSGDALLYSEPERAVVSRSGDDCVVALTDQWCALTRRPPHGLLRRHRCAPPPARFCRSVQGGASRASLPVPKGLAVPSRPLCQPQ